MLILVGALLLSYAVPLAMYFFLRGIRKDDANYKKNCWDLLWNGTLLGLPVFGFSLLCSIIFTFTGLKKNYPALEMIFSNFILKAFSEELMKYLPVRRIINKNRGSVSFLDIMAYCCISAMGFEIMESIVYIFSSSAGQILVRGFTNMHGAFGLTMGFIMALGYKKKWKNPVIPAIAAAVIIHGLYDLCLAETLSDDWGFISVIIAGICVIINVASVIFILKKKKDPYYTGPLFPEEAVKEESQTVIAEE